MTFVSYLAALGGFQETAPPVGAPAAPTWAGVTDNSTCPSCSGVYNVRVSWVNGELEQTRVYRNGSLVHTAVAGVTYWDDSGGAVGAENAYVVKHWNGSAESAGVSVSVTPEPCADALSTPTGAGLSAVSPTQINVTPTGGGADAAFFNIYAAGGALIDQIGAGEVYSHIGLSAGTQYSYDIEAESSTGCKSDKLTSQSVYTDLAAPAAPTVTALSANSLRVTLPSYGTGCDRFMVSYAGGAEINYVDSPGTYLDVSGLTPGTAYQFTVRAIDTSGNRGDSAESAYSASQATQNGTIASLNAVHSTADCPSPSIDVTWDVGDNNTATVKVERRLPSEGSYTTVAPALAAGTEAWEDTTHNQLLGTGLTYYRVSFNGVTGSVSATDTVTVDCRPTAPIGADCSLSGGDVTVTWNDASISPAETGFKIYRAPNSGGVPGTWVLKDAVGAGVETWDDVLPPEGTYHYAVSAYNATGESDKDECASNPITVSGEA